MLPIYESDESIKKKNSDLRNKQFQYRKSDQLHGRERIYNSYTRRGGNKMTRKNKHHKTRKNTVVKTNENKTYKVR
jgi:hypothetical protein